MTLRYGVPPSPCPQSPPAARPPQHRHPCRRLQPRPRRQLPLLLLQWWGGAGEPWPPRPAALGLWGVGCVGWEGESVCLGVYMGVWVRGCVGG